jgi:hypothetical protein
MNYTINNNNNNLNPTSGYWNLQDNSTSYKDVYADASGCTDILLQVIDKKNAIDASFGELNKKIDNFNDFVTNFSTYSNKTIDKTNSKDSKAICDSIPKGNEKWNESGIFNSVKSSSSGSYFSPYITTTNSKPDKNENEMCSDLNTQMTDIKTDISNAIAQQMKILNDSNCSNIDLNTLKKEYQAMVEKRKEYDYIINENNKHNPNSLVKTNLQETDIYIYTGVLWILLGTSALYFSFRYLNE